LNEQEYEKSRCRKSKQRAFSMDTAMVIVRFHLLATTQAGRVAAATLRRVGWADEASRRHRTCRRI